MKTTLREIINGRLVAESVDLKPTDKANNANVFWPVFYWQVVADVASKSLKQAWEAMVDNEVVPIDDGLRALGEGEHMVAESNRFSVLATVTKPRETFDRDLFIEKIAKKYKIDKVKLTALAEDCKSKGKPALSKRIVEAA